jgi:phage/plasmid-like protein (TIGR03299 family)
MGHNIMNNEAFASTKPAWHKLGTIVDSAMTTEEAARLGKLDYNVEQSPVQFEDAFGNVHTVDNRVVNYNGNTNKPFGVVSTDYKLLQNSEGIKFFDHIVGEGEAIIETAGALKNGQIAFMSAILPDYIRIKGTDDVTKKYLLLSMGHDGKTTTQVMFTPVRVVCNNTLSAALSGNKHKVTIRHRGDMNKQVEDAHKTLGIINQLSIDLDDALNQMTKTKIEDREALAMMNRLILSPQEIKLLQAGEKAGNILSTRKTNTLSGLKKYFYNGVGQDLDHCKGTVYGMYNAFNGYLSNKDTSNLDSKVTSLYFGQKATLIDTIFKQSLELV